MRAVLTITLSTLCLASTALAAGEPSATDALKARDAEIRAALPPKGQAVSPAVKAKLQTVLTRLVDLEGMAETTLGKNWDAQTPEKRRQFLDAFLAAFRAAVGGEIEFYRSSATTFGPEEPRGNTVDVPTTLLVEDEPTEIVYSMKKDASGWRIHDITIDGVSTVENYRASFSRIIAKEGFDALIKRLEKPAS